MCDMTIYRQFVEADPSKMKESPFAGALPMRATSDPLLAERVPFFPIQDYVLFLVACVLVWAAAGAAQINQGTGNLRVRLHFSDGRPCTIPAHVELMKEGSLTRVAEGYSDVNSGMVDFFYVSAGYYHAIVSAAGLEKADSGSFEIAARDYTQTIDIVVRPSGETSEPTHNAGSRAVDLDAPPKARKEYFKAAALMAKQDWMGARKHLHRALAKYPQYVDAYVASGEVELQLGNRAAARAAFQQAATMSTHYALPLIWLAKMAIQGKNFSEAEGWIRGALVADPDNIQLLVLLANVQLLSQHLDDAIAISRQVHNTAQTATPHSMAHFIAARAFQQQARPRESAAELEVFLVEEPSGPRADAARRELAQGTVHPHEPEPTQNWLPGIVEDVAKRSLNWAPADIDKTAPSVPSNVACPLTDILHQAAQRAQDLVVNLQRFSANERIEHVEFDKDSRPGSPSAGTFVYVAELREVRPGLLVVEEYRNGTLEVSQFPTRLATTGTAAFALIFHPAYSSDFEMSCEGFASWRGEPAWQVHFAQRRDRPARFQIYHVANGRYPALLKGRAWISSTNYQILRVETDLIEPIAAIRLERAHTAITYQSIEFRKRNLQLWLPQSADIYLDFRGHRSCDRHRFSDFKLFVVAAEQHDKLPRDADESSSEPDSTAN